jgi:hypothetical protein
MREMVIGIQVASSLATPALFCSYDQEVLRSQAGGVVIDPWAAGIGPSKSPRRHDLGGMKIKVRHRGYVFGDLQVCDRMQTKLRMFADVGDAKASEVDRTSSCETQRAE